MATQRRSIFEPIRVPILTQPMREESIEPPKFAPESAGTPKTIPSWQPKFNENSNTIILDKKLMDEAQPMIQRKTKIDLTINDPLYLPKFQVNSPLGVIEEYKKQQDSWVIQSSNISSNVRRFTKKYQNSVPPQQLLLQTSQQRQQQQQQQIKSKQVEDVSPRMDDDNNDDADDGQDAQLPTFPPQPAFQDFFLKREEELRADQKNINARNLPPSKLNPDQNDELQFYNGGGTTNSSNLNNYNSNNNNNNNLTSSSNNNNNKSDELKDKTTDEKRWNASLSKTFDFQKISSHYRTGSSSNYQPVSSLSIKQTQQLEDNKYQKDSFLHQQNISKSQQDQPVQTQSILSRINSSELLTIEQIQNISNSEDIPDDDDDNFETSHRIGEIHFQQSAQKTTKSNTAQSTSSSGNQITKKEGYSMLSRLQPIAREIARGLDWSQESTNPPQNNQSRIEQISQIVSLSHEPVRADIAVDQPYSQVILRKKYLSYQIIQGKMDKWMDLLTCFLNIKPDSKSFEAILNLVSERVTPSQVLEAKVFEYRPEILVEENPWNSDSYSQSRLTPNQSRPRRCLGPIPVESTTNQFSQQQQHREQRIYNHNIHDFPTADVPSINPYNNYNNNQQMNNTNEYQNFYNDQNYDSYPKQLSSPQQVSMQKQINANNNTQEKELLLFNQTKFLSGQIGLSEVPSNVTNPPVEEKKHQQYQQNEQHNKHISQQQNPNRQIFDSSCQYEDSVLVLDDVNQSLATQTNIPLNKQDIHSIKIAARNQSKNSDDNDNDNDAADEDEGDDENDQEQDQQVKEEGYAEDNHRFNNKQLKQTRVFDSPNEEKNLVKAELITNYIGYHTTSTTLQAQQQQVIPSGSSTRSPIIKPINIAAISNQFVREEEIQKAKSEAVTAAAAPSTLVAKDKQSIEGLMKEIEDIVANGASIGGAVTPPAPLDSKLQMLLGLVRYDEEGNDVFLGANTEELIANFPTHVTKIKGQSIQGVSKLRMLYVFFQSFLPFVTNAQNIRQQQQQQLEQQKQNNNQQWEINEKNNPSGQKQSDEQMRFQQTNINPTSPSNYQSLHFFGQQQQQQQQPNQSNKLNSTTIPNRNQNTFHQVQSNNLSNGNTQFFQQVERNSGQKQIIKNTGAVSAATAFVQFQNEKLLPNLSDQSFSSNNTSSINFDRSFINVDRSIPVDDRSILSNLNRSKQTITNTSNNNILFQQQHQQPLKSNNTSFTRLPFKQGMFSNPSSHVVSARSLSNTTRQPHALQSATRNQAENNNNNNTSRQQQQPVRDTRKNSRSPLTDRKGVLGITQQQQQQSQQQYKKQFISPMNSSKKPGNSLEFATKKLSETFTEYKKQPIGTQGTSGKGNTASNSDSKTKLSLKLNNLASLVRPFQVETYQQQQSDQFLVSQR